MSEDVQLTIICAAAAVAIFAVCQGASVLNNLICAWRERNRLRHR